jgi:hypothetical protein
VSGFTDVATRAELFYLAALATVVDGAKFVDAASDSGDAFGIVKAEL